MDVTPKPTPIFGFRDAYELGADDITLPVYESVQGTKPLIVLHEMPGMSESFIEYCSRMVGQGFKVYMPLMFASPNTAMSGWELLRFCVSREFRELFMPDGVERHARPVTEWLQELVHHVADENPDTKIGVMGMCLTGGFSLAAIAMPPVEAVIACQPAVPFIFNISTLGMSDEQRHEVSERAQSLPKPCAKGYRYADDLMCRESHMRAAGDLLGDEFERFPDLEGNAHSTLTGESFSQDVFDDVLQFLNSRL